MLCSQVALLVEAPPEGVSPPAIFGVLLDLAEWPGKADVPFDVLTLRVSQLTCELRFPACPRTLDAVTQQLTQRGSGICPCYLELAQFERRAELIELAIPQLELLADLVALPGGLLFESMLSLLRGHAQLVSQLVELTLLLTQVFADCRAPSPPHQLLPPPTEGRR